MQDPVQEGDFLLNKYGTLSFYMRIETDGHSEFCIDTTADGSIKIVSWSKKPRPAWAANEIAQVLMPKWIYGTYLEVNKECRRKATALGRGKQLGQLVGDDWIDAALYPGQIIIGRAWSNISRSIPQYHVDLIWKAVSSRYWPEQQAMVRQFAESFLKLPWTFLSVLSQNYEVARRSKQQLQLVEAAGRHWQTLVTLGPRFSSGAFGCEYLEEIPTLVQFSLARQGIAIPDLRSPLTAELLAYLTINLPGSKVKELAMQGRVAEAAEVIKEFSEETVLCSLAEHLVDSGYDEQACEIVRSVSSPDPHGIKAEWLAGKGNTERVVR